MTVDPYLEGFAEGRRSMARSIALKLRGALPDDELASLVGLSAPELEALLSPPHPRPEETVDSGEGAPEAVPAGGAAAGVGERRQRAHAVVRGLALVEPNFVRMVRMARHLTQPQLARMLGVNERTVCEWETASGPIRVKTASYDRLQKMSAALRKPRNA